MTTDMYHLLMRAGSALELVAARLAGKLSPDTMKQVLDSVVEIKDAVRGSRQPNGELQP